MTSASPCDVTSIAAALCGQAAHGQTAAWRESAACRQLDPELFFPIGASGVTAAAEIARAKAVCGRCPVRRPCLAYALRTGQEHGIWGGCDENDRRLLRRQWQETRRPAAEELPAPAGPREPALREPALREPAYERPAGAGSL